MCRRLEPRAAAWGQLTHTKKKHTKTQAQTQTHTHIHTHTHTYRHTHGMPRAGWAGAAVSRTVHAPMRSCEPSLSQSYTSNTSVRSGSPAHSRSVEMTNDYTEREFVCRERESTHTHIDRADTDTHIHALMVSQGRLVGDKCGATVRVPSTWARATL
jgi:hypothetical protein